MNRLESQSKKMEDHETKTSTQPDEKSGAVVKDEGSPEGNDDSIEQGRKLATSDAHMAEDSSIQNPIETATLKSANLSSESMSANVKEKTDDNERKSEDIPAEVASERPPKNQEETKETQK